MLLLLLLLLLLMMMMMMPPTSWCRQWLLARLTRSTDPSWRPTLATSNSISRPEVYLALLPPLEEEEEEEEEEKGEKEQTAENKEAQAPEHPPKSRTFHGRLATTNG